MTSIKIGPGSVAEYIVEQAEDMHVTARKLAEDGGEPTGEVVDLGTMADIADLEVQEQVFTKLYDDSEHGALSL